VGAYALALIVGFGGTGLRAQQPAPAALPPLPRYTPQPDTRARQVPARRVALQSPPPAAPAPPVVPAPRPTAPITPSGVTPVTPVPDASAAMEGRTEPLRSNTDLSLPRSEREGGGGEPTEAAAAADSATPAAEPEEAAKEPEKDPTKLLMKALGREDKPVKVYGWLQNSYTYNANGRGITGQNFGVTPNNLANQWQGNQYYVIVEKPLEQNDKINFGFRVDSLFGNDWLFNHSHGIFDTAFKINHFAGYDPAQFYAEMHLPWLTKGGIDIKGGRFYTILGYEVVPATGRPLLSVPYMFNYGQPFTHIGVLSTWHLTDRINIYNGAVNGSDHGIIENLKYNYLGGITWTSKDSKANIAISTIAGPQQYPRFLPSNTYIQPTGVPVTPPQFSGRVNPFYAGNDRSTTTLVGSYKWTDKFTQVIESDLSFEANVPFSSPITARNPLGRHNAEWQSFGNWFLWQFWKQDDRDIMTAVWRSEVFRDNNGIRTGFSDNFYEMTVGFIIKPKPYLWVRPEFRYDWAQFTHPYTDGTRNSQFTIGVDAILLF
jgi:hypothetical protein